MSSKGSYNTGSYTYNTGSGTLYSSKTTYNTYATSTSSSWNTYSTSSPSYNNGYNGYSSSSSSAYNTYTTSTPTSYTYATSASYNNGYNGGNGYSSASSYGNGYSSAPGNYYTDSEGYTYTVASTSASGTGYYYYTNTQGYTYTMPSEYSYTAYGTPAAKVAGDLAETDGSSGNDNNSWKNKAHLYEIIIIVLASVLGVGIIGAIIACVVGRRKEKARPSAYRSLHEAESTGTNAPLYGAEGGKSRYSDPYQDKE